LALKLYREGEELQRNNQLDEALARYNMAAAIIESGLPPERWMVDLYFTRATMDRSASANRDDAAAIDDYTKALRIDPNYSSALANRGLAFSRLKQYEAANADFTRLIEDPTVDYSHYGPGPTNGMAWAYEYRGRMWLDARRSAEAIPDLQNAVALYDGIYEKVYAQFFLADAYKSSQQHEQLLAEANSMAEQALNWAIHPGGTSEERSAAETGARWASEFLDHKASYQLEVLAAVKAKLGDFDEAVKEQEQALRELPALAENQRAAMQARLELYRNRTALIAP
jgi:tetratricopeptide (TPR) repeat protein